MLRWKSEKRETPSQATSETPPTASNSLPEVLLSQGKITQEQLKRAMEEQQKTGAFLGEILVEEGLLDETSLISFLAKHCKIPHLSLLDYLIEKDILALLPQELCLRYRLLPIDKMGRNLTVAMVNPLDAQALEAVRQHCPELRIKPILCAYRHFEAVTARFFNEEQKTSETLSMADLGLMAGPSRQPAPSEEETSAPDEPPVAERQDTAVEETVMQQVFHQSASSTDTPPSEAAAAEDDAEPIMREVASVMMDSMRDTYAMLARRMELFRGLASEDVARLFAQGITEEYAAGKTIFRKGQSGKALFVILGGAVRIQDGDREIAQLQRGDMFGEMALVSQLPRSADAYALADTSLLSLSMETIKDVMPADVSIQLLTNIIITLSDRLRQANSSA